MTVRSPRLFLPGAAVFAAALVLSACGGGSNSSPSTAASQPTTTETKSTTAEAGSPTKSPKPAGPRGGNPSKTGTQPSAPQLPPREVRRAGNAASFLVRGGDNSVPTYGSEASSSQRSLAEGSLAAFLGARAREDWSTACRYLTASARGRLEEFAKDAHVKAMGCAPVLKMFAQAEPSSLGPLAPRLASLRVKGGTAFALWAGPGNKKYAMPMSNEGGVWKVTQVAPLPYPPGSAP